MAPTTINSTPQLKPATAVANGKSLKSYAISPATQALLRDVEDGLYCESNVAKIWGVAAAELNKTNPPVTAVQRSENGRYTTNGVTDWTAGFFPGSIYALIERSSKHPSRFPSDKLHPLKLEFAGRWWASYLEPQITRTDTHDLAFVIQPALRREYEVHGFEKARNQVITAAYSLATRYNPVVKAIKSWDQTRSHTYHLGDFNGDCLVIIDNMMNLDMLFWAAKETGDLELANIATNHAKTSLRDFFRHPEWSTYHLVVYDKETGSVRRRMTHQGYADESTWSRGQAWAIHGFAQTYGWTKDVDFLDAAKKAADVFLSRISADFVPAWDFDAPDGDTIKDVSAGMIAAEGMIKIYQHTSEEKYLQAALRIIKGSLENYSGGISSFHSDGTVNFGANDVIFTHSTQNWNQDALLRYHSHGLVYADYYFLEIGNLLLDMGLY